jgi:hypothetical protein
MDAWRGRDIEDAQLVHLATETHVELAEAMRHTIAELHVKHDRVYRDLMLSRTQAKVYESIMRDERIDYQSRLEYYLEDVG